MASPCELSPSEQQQIQQWIAAHGTPQQVALRCRIVLGCSQGLSDVAVAKQLSVNHKTVILWRKRFAQQRLDGLWEITPGRGRKPRYDSDKIGAIVDATLQTKPKAMTPWSCRTMAKSQGVSKSTIHNIWQAHHLKPHRVKTFKPSRDPKFLEKLTDVVGLYLNPPQQAIVLCVDEKSQIQALDRTQPGLPLKKGRCGTMTPDYKRNGTTTLFAALETLQGKVIGQCYPRQRHQEFLKFLRRLDKEFPGDVPLHLVLDNYGTHKHEKVRSWFERHSRFELHFVPTSSSWLNLVERWFGELSEKAIRRGAFGSVEELKANSGEITAPCGVPTFAERFRQQLEQRLAEYELELSAEKTRLIEFGRYAAERRRRRGAGKPEGFDFLRFTHLCSRIWKSGGYTVKRKTVRKRMAAKLQAIGAQLRRRMHEPSVEQGRWLRRVLEGYYNYHAVPGNMRAMRSFQRQVARHWRQVLKRRSQRSCRRWEDFLPLLTQYVPWPSVRHPYPLDRFAATYPR